MLLAGRFFTCFGIVFLGFGALINIFGLSCIQTNQTDQMKAKVSVGAGFLVLLGSLSIGKSPPRILSNFEIHKTVGIYRSNEITGIHGCVNDIQVGKRIDVKMDLLFKK